MDWPILLVLVAVSIGAVIVAARRAARPDASVVEPSDDPHAGTIAEVAGQQGPRVYDIDG